MPAPAEPPPAPAPAPAAAPAEAPAPAPLGPASVAPAPPTKRLVAVVPHTHWDREWYLPFDAFRLRLVDMLDGFLARLETDPAYDRFLLDGQMAVVDDYLELRPEGAPRLEALARAGRLSVGPWYVLMDEFLVSGETIVRNLQLGLRTAEALGGALPVGYLPDMFGHIAQMPQLLRLAGFEDAVVWRGVPAAVDRSAFWWQAPDGSTVRAEYLVDSYSAGSAIPDDADAFLRRAEAWAGARDRFALAPDAPLLWLNGTDHQAPQPWLGRVLAQANAAQADLRFVVSSLPEYLAKAGAEGLATWRGELRSSARANLLMGVASNRVDLKAAAARAERVLERLAEPLCALWLASDRWPAPELALAWRQMIRNSAHDSICACSDDQVAAAVLQRYSEAATIAEVLRRRALDAAAATLGLPGPVILNPSAQARGGVVELIVDGEEPIPGSQLVELVPTATAELIGTGDDLGHLLGRLAADGFRPHADLQLDDDETGGLTLRFTTTGEHRPAGLAGASVLAETETRTAAQPARPLRLVAHRPGWQRVAVRVESVPGFGWSSWQPGPLAVPPVKTIWGKAPPGAPESRRALTLDNGLLAVTVDDADATWTLAPSGRPPLRGLGRLVDGGDAGDTYNYCPPADDTVVDRPVAVTVEVVESGPLRAVARVRAGYRWPEKLVDNSRVGGQAVEVVTDLELRAGEDLLRVATRFDNRCRDHRLRAWFPLPGVAHLSRAECAFAVVERGLTAEGGRHEYGLATFPSRRFVSAGALTVLHEGLIEYQLDDGGKALALTLLRATGILSQPVMAYRDNSAGPQMPLEGPEMIGPVAVRYALHYGDRDPYRLAEDAWVPLQVATGSAWPWAAVPPAAPAAAEPVGAGTAATPVPPAAGAATGSRLQVDGAEVSALQRVGGLLELRVFNPSALPATVAIAGRSGWLVDLRGTQRERFEGTFELRPSGIATARLDS